MSRSETPFTAIVRRGPKEYVGIALEYNVAARGRSLTEVEVNLREAVEALLTDAEEEGAVVEPIPTAELIEFLRDTAPVAPSFELSGSPQAHRAPMHVLCYE